MSSQADAFSPYVWRPTTQDADKVVAEYGTPCFMYSEAHLRKPYTELAENLSNQISVFYSLKANPCLGVTRCLVEQGAGCEVSSAGELYAAQLVGGAENGLLFVGPGKTEQELHSAVDDDRITLVCESLSELRRFNDLLREAGETSTRNVLLRVNPAFKNKSSKLSMAGKPRQFGIDEATLFTARKCLASMSHVVVVGFHAYMGTRILDHDTIAENTGKLLSLYEALAEALGITLELVDVGGGFGVPYYDGETGLAPAEIADTVNRASQEFRSRHAQTRIVVELGRFLTAGSGALLVSIVDMKISRGKTFAIADGGTNVHMAANGLGSFAMKTFPIMSFADPSLDVEEYTVTGPLCTPNDLLAKNIRLGRLKVGDQVVVLMSGAYGASASPTGFLSHGQPAEVLLDEAGGMTCLVSRPSAHDLFHKHHIA